jgi:tRNA/rRNA methyltransferase
VRHPVKRLEDGGRVIRKRLASSRVAILFGSEKFGLSNEDLSHCNWLLRIPTREEHRSMNLGQAVAVCLYELARNSKIATPLEKSNLATAGDIDRVAALLLDALHASGSLKSRSAPRTEEKLRRLMRRHNLTADDAKFWLGMFRQIVWKLSPPT